MKLSHQRIKLIFLTNFLQSIASDNKLSNRDNVPNMGNYGGLRRNHDNSRRNGMNLSNKIETPCLKTLSFFFFSKFQIFLWQNRSHKI